MSTEQLELLPTRRAVLLDAPAAPTRRVVVSWGDEFVRRVVLAETEKTKRAGEAGTCLIEVERDGTTRITADRVVINGDVTMSGQADPELVIGYTGWECVEPPPCAGFWEVTDHQTGMPPVRVWFEDNEWDTSLTPEAIKAPGIIKQTMTHEEFRKLYAWRGLKAPWPGGYHFAMKLKALV